MSGSASCPILFAQVAFDVFPSFLFFTCLVLSFFILSFAPPSLSRYLAAISKGAAGSRSLDLYAARILQRDMKPGECGHSISSWSLVEWPCSKDMHEASRVGVSQWDIKSGDLFSGEPRNLIVQHCQGLSCKERQRQP